MNDFKKLIQNNLVVEPFAEHLSDLITLTHIRPTRNHNELPVKL